MLDLWNVRDYTVFQGNDRLKLGIGVKLTTGHSGIDGEENAGNGETDGHLRRICARQMDGVEIEFTFS
ncbi:hypothetical protein [Gimesia chilikensis]|uniref:hypothetical protein n=1 Tax=Gimesia chilikensis TaxID=2605989 RepID=UPI00119F8FB2|nr:hypothetical protein [Gimesia chilikensis]